MRRVVTPWLLALAAAALWSPTAAAQAQLPDGVTQEMIAQGQKLFAGQGLCMACHGTDAKGIPNLGADLSDQEWIHSDGSYQGILKSIMDGVASDRSTTGTVMPPKGGSRISAEQLKAVAAYVWSISRKS